MGIMSWKRGFVSLIVKEFKTKKREHQNAFCFEYHLPGNFARAGAQMKGNTEMLHLARDKIVEGLREFLKCGSGRRSRIAHT